MTLRVQFSINQVETGKTSASTRKLYKKPEIIHEFELETRAGSPIPGGIDLLDPDHWDSSGQ